MQFVILGCSKEPNLIARYKLLTADRIHGSASGVLRGFSTATAIEEPIQPPVQVNHTQLLINGQFVDSASGKFVSLI